MSYLHSLHYYSKTDPIKYLTFCTKLKNQIKTSLNTFNIPMTPRCYHVHKSHIQAHELRVSGELEFGRTEPDSPCTYKQLSEIRPAWYRIYFHSWHLPWDSDFTINQHKLESRDDKSGVACTCLPINLPHSLSRQKDLS